MSKSLHQIATAHHLIRRKQVEQSVGISRSTIYGKLDENSPQYDPDFPKPIHIGVRMVAWLESEVQSYIELRIYSSRNQPKQVGHATKANKTPIQASISSRTDTSVSHSDGVHVLQNRGVNT